MSCTSIYGFGVDGEICCETEIKNAWLGSMAIWMAMEERHLPQYVPEYAKSMGLHPGASKEQILEKMYYLPSRCTDYANMKAIQEVWDLADNEDLPLDERICLCSTFDKVLIKKENFARVAQAFRAFGGDTSLPEEADVLDALAKDENIIAAGFSSSLAPGWSSRGPADEDGDAAGYNCLKQDDHFWLSDDIKL